MKIGVLQAIVWTIGVRLALLLVAPLAIAVAPALRTNFVMQAAYLSAFMLGGCALFAARRPGRSWSETFASRKTSPWMVLLAAAIGVAIYVPANAFSIWVEHSFPMSAEEKQAYAELLHVPSRSHAIAMFAFVAVVGPVAEELFFRGALYTGLRPDHSPAFAGLATGILFTISHEQPRFWPAILALGALLSFVRAVSGSIWPAVFLHVAFNATSLAVSDDHPLFAQANVPFVLGCTAISLLFAAIVGWIGRASSSADRARQVDLKADPGLGETQS